MMVDEGAVLAVILDLKPFIRPLQVEKFYGIVILVEVKSLTIIHEPMKIGLKAP
jgi:hypothetical protein